MSNGWHELPLVFFTVLSQCVVGAFIILVYGWFSTNDNQVRKTVISRMFFLWVMMSIAFAASTFHLGSPLRALNSLNRIGHSALSNEIAAGSVFFGIAGLWWITSWLNILPVKIAKVFALVAVISGLLFLYLITKVYSSVPTIPAWNNVFTPLSFYMTTLIVSPVLGVALLFSSGIELKKNVLHSFMVLVVFLSLMITILQWNDLSLISTSLHRGNEILPEFPWLVTLKYFLITTGLFIFFFMTSRRVFSNFGWLFLSFIMVFSGEIIGRFIFYSLHFTVGLV
ncbi:dimethyl sulfoxide reductase [Leminorella grimontii]|uniref:Dimethyl sulfoxide reductase n=1 Tax=Leminorella grimontii TaxID=82981 RepID=A0AAV5MWN0_9GAMM|nr:DmsC/YnfH family molybdoenzyme membrane anchor subunit [Leminorella grimontii]KFC96555.1 anaerobic dimethyl sulfoxide reductase chain C [Leminorella grimontii ATCC 33999 = DSM 5078]GKX54246.1 dimethyl sulfoxide reductase [Leminorella grimontii]GKX57687.1 dimethyl sulfoxide reductase [Leminorella grimontii]